VDNHASALRDLEQQHRAMGGDLIERWEPRRVASDAARRVPAQIGPGTAGLQHSLNWTLPGYAGGFAELVARRGRRSRIGSRTPGAPGAAIRFRPGRTQAAWQFGSGRSGSGCVAAPPSNISADMLDVRRSIASALGCRNQRYLSRRLIEVPCPGIRVARRHRARVAWLRTISARG